MPIMRDKLLLERLHLFSFLCLNKQTQLHVRKNIEISLNNGVTPT